MIIYEGKQYEPTGEFRHLRDGDYYVSSQDGNPVRTAYGRRTLSDPVLGLRRFIVRPLHTHKYVSSCSCGHTL